MVLTLRDVAGVQVSLGNICVPPQVFAWFAPPRT